MTEKKQGPSVWVDEQWEWWADFAAFLVAISLPWSTSATSILLVIWILLALPTVYFRDCLRMFAVPAGAVPVAVWLLAVVGVLWANLPLGEAYAGLKGLHKLLVIPLCMLQFRRSDKGMWVFGGFLASCTMLLVFSWVVWVWPELWPGPVWGVPVKDYVVQSGEFTICAFALMHLAFGAWDKGRRWLALGCFVLSAIFLANMVFVATARTSLIVYLLLAGLLGFQRFGWKGGGAFLAVAATLGTVALSSSTYLQDRIDSTDRDVARYERENVQTSTGLRIEFWKKSIRFVAEAPIIGHGTGSIGRLFRDAAVGDENTSSGTVTGNVHNMTLQFAIQFGLTGVTLLYALWLAHFWLFTYGTARLSPVTRFAAMIGAALVVQNAVGSLFLAYLADYSTGWLYVLGVGVAGGMVLREQKAARLAKASATPRAAT